MIAGNEQHAIEVPNGVIDEPVDTCPLLDAVFVRSGQIKTSGMPEIAGHNQHISLRQLPPEALGLEVKVAEIMAAHGGRLPANRKGAPSMRRMRGIVG
jgi:hypothetical protein